MKKIKVLLTGICLFIIVGCAIVLLPFTRQIIISLAESFLNRDLKDYHWMSVLYKMAIRGILITSIICFLINFINMKIISMIMNSVNNAIKFIIKPFKEEEETFKSLITKKSLILLSIVFAIYLFGISSIIRTGYSYMDDVDVSVRGYLNGTQWGRYFADFLISVIHVNKIMVDISPLEQVLGVFFMALTTIIFIRSLNGDRYSIPIVIAALPIGLWPHLLQNYAMKIGFPSMLISILFSVIPFLFYKKKSIYVIMSCFGLWGMCLTYQAASGIYIVLTCFIAYKMWIEKEIPGIKILRFVLISIGCYMSSLGLYKILTFFTIENPDKGYVSTVMLSPHELIPGIVANSIKYVTTLYNDLKFGIFIPCFIISILLFIIISIISSKRNRIITTILSTLTIVAMVILSNGAYLALERPIFMPRIYFGLNIVIAIILTFNVVASKALNKILRILSISVVVVFCYNMLIFEFMFGNALAEQHEYQNFRTTILIEDINRFVVVDEYNSKKDYWNQYEHSGVEWPLVRMENNIGYAPAVENMSRIYPLVKELVYVWPYGGSWWGHLSLYNYRFEHRTDYESESEWLDKESLPILTNNNYHTIRGDGRKFFITLK